MLNDRTLSDAAVQLPLLDQLICKRCLILKVFDIQKIGEVSLDDCAFVSHNDAVLLGTHLLVQHGVIEIKWCICYRDISFICISCSFATLLALQAA